MTLVTWQMVLPVLRGQENDIKHMEDGSVVR